MILKQVLSLLLDKLDYGVTMDHCMFVTVKKMKSMQEYNIILLTSNSNCDTVKTGNMVLKMNPKHIWSEFEKYPFSQKSAFMTLETSCARNASN